MRDVVDVSFGKGDHLFHDLCNRHHLFLLLFLMFEISIQKVPIYQNSYDFIPILPRLATAEKMQGNKPSISEKKP